MRGDLVKVKRFPRQWLTVRSRVRTDNGWWAIDEKGITRAIRDEEILEVRQLAADEKKVR